MQISTPKHVRNYYLLQGIDFDYTQIFGEFKTTTIFYNDEKYFRTHIEKWENFSFRYNTIVPYKSILCLDRMRLCNISGISDLKSLQHVSISSNPELSDFSSIRNISGLKSLELRRNKHTDISFLMGSNLLYLNLIGNEIENINPLHALQQIQRLYLGENNIIDISPLAELYSLRYLNLNGNPIKNIEPLFNLKNLNCVSLLETNISNIEISELKIRLPNCRFDVTKR